MYNFAYHILVSYFVHFLRLCLCMSLMSIQSPEPGIYENKYGSGSSIVRIRKVHGLLGVQESYVMQPFCRNERYIEEDLT